MRTMTDIPSRLSPDEARARLVAIIDSNQVAKSARSFTRKLVKLDAWPPEDPREVALCCLDPDEAPDEDEAKPSAMFAMASILLSLAEYRAFEAGRASLPTIPDVISVTAARARELLTVVGKCLKLGGAMDSCLRLGPATDDAVLPSLEDALREYVENEARMGMTITRLRDCLYPGGTGAVEHGADELGTVNNILIEMGYGPIDGRDGPDDVDTDDGEEEAG